MYMLLGQEYRDDSTYMCYVTQLSTKRETDFVYQQKLDSHSPE